MKGIFNKPIGSVFLKGNRLPSMIFSTGKDEKNAFHTGAVSNYLV